MPICALLSGGLDSSAVVAVAAQLLQAQNRSLTTLSAVLPKTAAPGLVDEKPFIEAFRSWDNIDRVYIADPGRGPFDDVEWLIWGGEAPSYTSRHYQYSAFAQAVGQCGGRVLLDGVGGELGPTIDDTGFYPELLLKGRWGILARELGQRAGREDTPHDPITRQVVEKGQHVGLAMGPLHVVFPHQ